MKKIALACASLAFGTGSVGAVDKDLEFMKWLNEEVSSCVSEGSDKGARLRCYDAMAKAIGQKISAYVGDPGPLCELKHFSYMMKGSHGYITGEMSCAEGRLDYRLYDASNDSFLESGRTYFQGYAFQFYTNAGKLPATLSIRYSTSTR
jgi:hypothetical protein